ncbi:MAG: 2,3-diphosphoglycerate-dependent phosphoglycerate mutase [bacterium]
MNKLIIIRHGESVWNKENIFTGWVDVDLSPQGEDEAHKAGKSLKEAGMKPDMAFVSVLKRAVKTLDIVLGELGQNIPIFNSWRLNERHYGALQGLNKSETTEKYGEEQVKIWRRSYNVRPPTLKEGDSKDAFNDPKYSGLKREEVPLAESLDDTTKRLMPYWEEVIFPEIKKGKNVLIAGHGSGVRALVKHLDGLSEEEVMDLNIPTAVPLVYEFDENYKPIKHYYLGNQAEIASKIEKVKNQTSIKK